MPIGSGRARYGDGTDLTLVTFGNGVPMSLRVARRLAAGGIGARVFDLRWLAPLPVEELLREARRPAGCWSSTRPGGPAGSPRE